MASSTIHFQTFHAFYVSFFCYHAKKILKNTDNVKLSLFNLILNCVKNVAASTVSIEHNVQNHCILVSSNGSIFTSLFLIFTFLFIYPSKLANVIFQRKMSIQVLKQPFFLGNRTTSKLQLQLCLSTLSSCFCSSIQRCSCTENQYFMYKITLIVWVKRVLLPLNYEFIRKKRSVMHYFRHLDQFSYILVWKRDIRLGQY